MTRLRNIGIAVTVPSKGADGAEDVVALTIATLVEAAAIIEDASIFASVPVRVASLAVVTVPNDTILVNPAKTVPVIPHVNLGVPLLLTSTPTIDMAPLGNVYTAVVEPVPTPPYMILPVPNVTNIGVAVNVITVLCRASFPYSLVAIVLVVVA
jgi:hypothetical protein